MLRFNYINTQVSLLRRSQHARVGYGGLSEGGKDITQKSNCFAGFAVTKL